MNSINKDKLDSFDNSKVKCDNCGTYSEEKVYMKGFSFHLSFCSNSCKEVYCDALFKSYKVYEFDQNVPLSPPNMELLNCVSKLKLFVASLKK